MSKARLREKNWLCKKTSLINAGETVEDLARKFHKDIAAKIKCAQVWGSSVLDGQKELRCFFLQNGDVVEQHAWVCKTNLALLPRSLILVNLWVYTIGQPFTPHAS